MHSAINDQYFQEKNKIPNMSYEKIDESTKKLETK